ncbi:aminotransferase class V-fold PLP-dependent enzyme [Pedobacter cryoconitis]|uniref:Selenocysteine lyase/cysteine desulfurase n=1 Tax=Pedobacter cryoconitis TaxID=188932 RepID=A0A327RXG5_9SPHI|nr:aminotransferase class V-fold PLP-dependent enzyme [Pedobacter cryoconitis]RAJ21161.1 selenocysteine lyase/cysteine desulfurase [Pedobacter cryoconitis]
MDLNVIRKETRGCTNKIFLNSAGSSLVTDTVFDQMIDSLTEEAQIGGYALANLNQQGVDEFYTETAQLLNCNAENISFQNSATDAYAKAISSIEFKAGDVILTTDDDYISNQISFISLKKRVGINIVRAANLANGDLDLAAFEELVKLHQPKLVALTHIPTSSGLIQAVAEVGAICRKYNCWYLVDACQSVGQLVVDVQEIGCDFLAATGRKFLRGPRGTGFLYVSDRALEAGLAPLIIDMIGAEWTSVNDYTLQPTAKRFEFWESSIPSRLAFKEAIKYANQVGMANIEKYNAVLMAQFRSQLKEVKGLNLQDWGSKVSSILTFTMDHHTTDEIAQHLRENDVYFSIAFAGSAMIDFPKKNIKSAIRLSPHYFNTAEELEKVVAILDF